MKAAGIKFAYAKVIEGLDYPDATWQTNRAGSLAVGIPIAGYYWAHPNLDPIACVAAFMSRLNLVSGMLHPVLDMEHNGNPGKEPTGAGGISPSGIHQWISRFRNGVQSWNSLGARLDTYTGGWFWNSYVLPGIPASAYGDYQKTRLYLSRYASAMGPIPRPWTSAAVWQYTETGSVPGVPSTFEDQDVLVGTEQLSDLIYTTAPTNPVNPNEELPDMIVARPTTPGNYLLISGAGVTVLQDGESASALKKAGVPLVTLTDRDFAPLKALAK